MLSGVLSGARTLALARPHLRGAFRNAHPPRSLEFERGDFWVVLNQDQQRERSWTAVVFHEVQVEADARSLLRDLAGQHPDAPGALLAHLDARLPSTPMTTPGWVDRMLAVVMPHALTPQPGYWYRGTARDHYGALFQPAPRLPLPDVLDHLRQLGPQGGRIAQALADIPACPLEVGVPLPAVLLHISDPNEDGDPPEHGFMLEYRDWQGLAHDELGSLSAVTHAALVRGLRATLKQRARAVRLVTAMDAHRA